MNLRQTGKKRNFRSLIGFEIFFKTACLSFAFPAFEKMFEFCLWAAGYSYITKENIVEFILSPCVLVGCGIAGIVFSLLAVFEANAVCLAVRENKSGMRRTFPELFFDTVAETVLLFRNRRKGIKIALCCVLCVGVVNLPGILFVSLGLSWSGGETGVLSWMIGLMLLGIGAAGICGLIFGEKRSILHGILRRGLCLFVAEGFIYMIGWCLLVFFVIQSTSSEVSGVLLLRSFERYHLISGILFISLNTVVFEYFFASICSDGFEEDKRTRKKDREKSRQKQWREICFWFACVLISLTAVTQTVSFFRNKSVLASEALEKICITAHRGASKKAPENTMASIALAVKEGADYVEIDVRLTADGVPVLLHDKGLVRTTSVLKNVDEVTYKELSVYDAGSSHSDVFAGEKIPRLEDVFLRFGGKIGFNIEIKEKNSKEIVGAVVELIEKYGLEESCIVSSTAYPHLEQVKEKNRGLKTGYILSMVYGDFYDSNYIDFFSIKSGFITENVVERAHERGKEVHAWTVNNENELKRMKAIGVDNIITDTPAYAREIVQKNRFADTFGEWISVLTSQK